ncbi:NADP-dependent oxidoreductase domain-containing protein 1 isoform X1 [Stegostoma tigrinum]|uniref:NADP-dependent oxidoreductase domain-containing protein 1 isoform X1 n=2 Tax=Stegostoma tigrinum TaxID=3053191 RepID=UPI0028706D84|nr:NADP-dependent oxidoreductase domain-containing protein 1 isoform X1 [Stegostoma tigrinum]
MARGQDLKLTQGLPSLAFEVPLTEEEIDLSEYLRIRTWSLTVCACAHAAFYCRLLTAVRCKILNGIHFTNSWMAKYQILQFNRGALRIGVLGCGRFGKQLVLSLLHLTDLTATCITVSTRRPEKLSDLSEMGIKCFYDNKRLAASVDVMFLCCLPSQLLAVSSQIHGCIAESCVVYSVVTAVPAARLKNLLAHSSIVRPHYFFHRKSSWPKLWQSGITPVEALKIQEVIEATSPFKKASILCLDPKWIEVVMYSVLNALHLLKVPHHLSLDVLNDLMFNPSQDVEAIDNPTLLTRESFVNASCIQSLSFNSLFPWFDLASVSMRNTPLTKFFLTHPRLQVHLSFIYRMSLLRKKQLSEDSDCCGR